MTFSLLFWQPRAALEPNDSYSVAAGTEYVLTATEIVSAIDHQLCGSSEGAKAA